MINKKNSLFYGIENFAYVVAEIKNLYKSYFF